MYHTRVSHAPSKAAAEAVAVQIKDNSVVASKAVAASPQEATEAALEYREDEAALRLHSLMF